MRKYLYYLVLVLAVAAVYAYKNPSVDFEKENPEGILFFKGSWEEAMAKAKKENKPIFLDIYATWCGPCKMLSKYTFSDKEVAAYYNQNFINVSLDGEKGTGAFLANQYRITGYPTLLFIKPNGQVKLKTTGYHNSKQFLKLGNQILSK